MTDSIDLDELDVQPDDEDEPNRGDWFWGDDSPEDGAAAAEADDAGASAPGPASASTAADGSDGWRSGAARADELGADEPGPREYDDLGADRSSSTPRVPYADDDKPVGIPREGGGGGGVPANARDEKTQEQPEASGPHGGGAGDMTLALSYRAVRSLENLHTALSDAETWTDYVGIVGDVDAHVINKFQRDNMIDLDFFNGTGTGPGERLAEVSPTSMFYADRMALVGVESAGERAWAEAADWEFVPLAEAAEASGWELDDDASGDTDDEAGDGTADPGTDGTGGE